MERRNTVQKELVLDAVTSLHRHVTADEVYDYIKVKRPSIGKGTVYRNLAILAEEGKIRRIENSEGPDRYDYLLKKHYHVRCIACGEIFDVDMDEIPDMDKRIRDSHGIVFIDYDILFKGICPGCQKNQILKNDKES